jgi:hypothetical protein
VRKRKANPNSVIPPETADFWEQMRITVLRSQPTSQWEKQLGIWHAIRENHHSPAAARRIVFAAIEICAQRGDAFPELLTDIVRNTFEIKPSRTSPKKARQIAEAVQLMRENPSLSLSKVAKRVGVSRQALPERPTPSESPDVPFDDADFLSLSEYEN